MYFSYSLCSHNMLNPSPYSCSILLFLHFKKYNLLKVFKTKMKLLYHTNKRRIQRNWQCKNDLFLTTLRNELNNYNYNVYNFTRVSI